MRGAVSNDITGPSAVSAVSLALLSTLLDSLLDSLLDFSSSALATGSLVGFGSVLAGDPELGEGSLTFSLELDFVLFLVGLEFVADLVGIVLMVVVRTSQGGGRLELKARVGLALKQSKYVIIHKTVRDCIFKLTWEFWTKFFGLLWLRGLHPSLPRVLIKI